MFTRIMDAISFGEILDASLVPVIAECFPDEHHWTVTQNTEAWTLRGTLKYTT